MISHKTETKSYYYIRSFRCAKDLIFLLISSSTLVLGRHRCVLNKIRAASSKLLFVSGCENNLSFCLSRERVKDAGKRVLEYSSHRLDFHRRGFRPDDSGIDEMRNSIVEISSVRHWNTGFYTRLR